MSENKHRQPVKMTLEEAKEFYLAHNGSTFSMCMESPQKYNAFLKVKMNKQIQNNLDRMILENTAKCLLEEGSARSFRTYFDALDRLSSDYGEYLEKFYQLTDHAAARFDPMQKILIMEEFGGRNADAGNGILERIARKKADKQRMLDCLQRLMAFDPRFYVKELGWEHPDERYLSAKEKINQAIRLYF